MISYRHDTGAWLNAEQGSPSRSRTRQPARRGGTLEMTPFKALEDLWI
jgi:hypothetical protein